MRRTIRRAIGLVLVLVSSLLAAPAEAAFTEAEQASLLQLHQAWTTLHGYGLGGYIASIKSKYASRSTYSQIGEAARVSASVAHELNDAIGVVLGVNPNVPGTAYFEAFAAKSRPDRLAEGYVKLDRAINAAESARALWDQVVTAAGGALAPAELVDWVRRTKVALEMTRDHIRAFDRSLGYLDPHPQPPFPNGRHGIVGPHGDYVEAQWNLWRSAHYFVRAMSSLAQAMKLGSPTGEYTNMGRPYMSLSLASRNSINTMYVYAAVPFSEGLRTKSRFFQVLEAAGFVTSGQHPGTPMTQHFVGFEWRDTFAPKMGRDRSWDAFVWDAIVIALDAWKHSDHGGAWMLLIFPDCTVLKNPQGCSPA